MADILIRGGNCLLSIHLTSAYLAATDHRVVVFMPDEDDEDGFRQSVNYCLEDIGRSGDDLEFRKRISSRLQVFEAGSTSAVSDMPKTRVDAAWYFSDGDEDASNVGGRQPRPG